MPIGYPTPIAHYRRLSRPFTLIAPAAGIVSGGIIALGAADAAGAAGAVGAVGAVGFTAAAALNIFCAAIAASALNAASNALNQIFDVEVDRINCPHRPLPAGKISPRGAGLFAAAAAAVALALAWLVKTPDGGRPFLLIVIVGMMVTAAYSVPPLRLKRWWFTAGPTIATARGLLLVAAGWAAVRQPWNVEPWFIGAVMGLFILGACATKDFAHVKGDEQTGCLTLPVRFGVAQAAIITAPFFVIPFFLIPVGVRLGALTGNADILGGLWPILSVSGFIVACLNVTTGGKGGRAVWVGMYLMMVIAQVGLAAAYVFQH